MLHFTLALLAAIFVAATTAILSLDSIRERLRVHKRTNRDIAVLVKDAMQTGKVRIVAQVFAPDGKTLRHRETMEADRLDAEAERAFAEGNRVEIKL